METSEKTPMKHPKSQPKSAKDLLRTPDVACPWSGPPLDYIDCACAGDSHSPMSIRKAGRILQVSAPEQFGISVPYSILPRMRENFHEFSITAARYSIFICFYIFICSFCTVGRTAGIKIYCGSMEGWPTVMRMSFQEWRFPNTSNGSDHSNVPVILCVVVQFCSFSHNLIQNMVSIQQKSSLSGWLNKKTGGVFLEPYVFCHQSIHQGLSEPTSRSSFRWCCQQGISAPGWLFPKGYKDQRNPRSTLQETNISHHWKSKIIFKSAGWDGKLLIPSRVSHLELGRDQWHSLFT